jgi:propane monooxygenase small subunit
VLFSMLTNDEAHGAENKATLQGWLDTYTPAAVNAAHNLQPIWSQLSEKVVRYADSFDRSKERFDGLLGDLGLESPKGVTA